MSDDERHSRFVELVQLVELGQDDDEYDDDELLLLLLSSSSSS